MKRFIKMLTVACAAALALAAVSAAGASAAEFTASETGNLEGEATSIQVFDTEKGSNERVECTEADTSGEIIDTAAVEQEVTVQYTDCTAKGVPIFGEAPATITPATYNLTANGEVHILNTIRIVVEAPLFPCEIVVGPQAVGSVEYDPINKGTGSGTIEETSAVEGIESTSTGLCPNGTNGTYTGNNLVHREGGGEVSFD